MSILYPKPILCNVLKELCAIRDNITICDIRIRIRISLFRNKKRGDLIISINI